MVLSVYSGSTAGFEQLFPGGRSQGCAVLTKLS